MEYLDARNPPLPGSRFRPRLSSLPNWRPGQRVYLPARQEYGTVDYVGACWLLIKRDGRQFCDPTGYLPHEVNAVTEDEEAAYHAYLDECEEEDRHAVDRAVAEHWIFTDRVQCWFVRALMFLTGVLAAIQLQKWLSAL